MANIYRLMGKKAVFPLFICALLLLAMFLEPSQSIAADWRSQSMLYPRHSSMPLLPFLDYYIDESFSMDIEDASSPSRQGAYQPLVLEKLPRTEGIVWLRFIIAPMQSDAKAPVYLLDMGQSVPGSPRLYDAARNELSGAWEWRENTPAQRNIILLPEQGSEPLTCYLRLDGLPGPWFAPMVRSPQDAAGNWSSLSRTGAILALAVVMLLCLLRGMSEKGQWRIWTALYVGVALAQALAGMPEATDNFNMGGLPAILLPGIALMLLPHVGRHLMNTPARSKALDIQLLLLSLPGAALALWPLVPGWDWLDRWLDLWPAGAVLFIPTALGAWIMGLGGSRRFLLGCIIPPLFVGIALLGLDFGMPPNLLASFPLWGVALSALLIAATKSPLMAAESGDGKNEGEAAQKSKKSPSMDADLGADSIINLEHPLDDPHLRLVDASEGGMEKGFQEGIPRELLEQCQLEKTETPKDSFEYREMALREPLDEILRQGAALGECALPPAVRRYAEDMLAASRRMADIISGKDSRAEDDSEGGGNAVFNLQSVIRKAHDAVAPLAGNAGISLSWYMQPNICQEYQGNGEKLEKTLRLLLESAARASSGGMVSLSARDVSENGEKGRILFEISDNGAGRPPEDRSSLALAKAWELAAAHKGSIAVESGPKGANIAFSARFPPFEKNGDQSLSLLPHVIIVCEEISFRREIALILEDLPCRLCEAASMEEALKCQREAPGSLLIASGRFAMPAAADMVGKFKELAFAAGIPECHVLAITDNDSQWGLLKPSGFTHAMLAPLDPLSLRETVSKLMGEPVSKENADTVAKPVFEKDKAAEIGEQTNTISGPAGEETVKEKLPDLEISGQGEEIKAQSAHVPPSKDIDSGPADFAMGFEGPEWLGGEDDEDKLDGENSGIPERGGAVSEAIASAAEESLKMDKDSPRDSNANGVEDSKSSIEPAIAENETILADESAKSEEFGAPAESVNELKENLPEDLAVSELNENARAGLGDVAEEIVEKSPEPENSLMDYILGARKKEAPLEGEKQDNLSAQYEAAKENARIALAAVKKNSSVSSFVNSSVELVTKTFSSVLRGEEALSKMPASEKESRDEAENFVAPPSAPKLAEKEKIASLEVDATRIAPEPAAPSKASVLAADNIQPVSDVRSDPAIVQLVASLDQAIKGALDAFEREDGAGVAKCTGIIAAESQSFGLRLLARMAHCVERAGNANDMNALRDLLPELANAVERNRITLSQKD